MSRYTGPKWKLSRRLGISLSGTGKELARRPYAPGQHGNDRRVRFQNMVIKENKTFNVWFNRTPSELIFRAGKIREGKHGVNLMILLEQRLDNIVYRLV